ncbi:hypothetical protein F4801DRAFT_579856 [Xylaria longipes]|nr:hypothetical protein F4801DRAFT_579856 [Xylaria longipes]
MSRAPVSGTELTQRECHPTMILEEHARWESLLRQTINNPEELYPSSPSVSLGSHFTIIGDLAGEKSDENNDEYEHISEDTHSSHKNNQGENESSDFSLESYNPVNSDSETLSEFSDEWPSEDEDTDPRYLPHHGSLRGVVGGVVCEFTPHDNLLNISDPWFPYMRYPLNFHWSCCGARFGEPYCLRIRSPVAEASASSGFISPNLLMS